MKISNGGTEISRAILPLVPLGGPSMRSEEIGTPFERKGSDESGQNFERSNSCEISSYGDYYSVKSGSEYREEKCSDRLFYQELEDEREMNAINSSLVLSNSSFGKQKNCCKRCELW